MPEPPRKPPEDRPAFAEHLDWLESTADRLEKEATEDEALATGRAISGSLQGRLYFNAADRAEEKRNRAAEYRRKAMNLRIEETKRRRAPSPRHHQ